MRSSSFEEPSSCFMHLSAKWQTLGRGAVICCCVLKIMNFSMNDPNIKHSLACRYLVMRSDQSSSGTMQRADKQNLRRRPGAHIGSKSPDCRCATAAKMGTDPRLAGAQSPRELSGFLVRLGEALRLAGADAEIQPLNGPRSATDAEAFQRLRFARNIGHHARRSDAHSTAAPQRG